MWFRHFIFILSVTSWCFSQVLITEVMYDLPGPDSPNEYVELYNANAYTVSLAGWQIRDRYTTDDLIDTTFGYLVPAYSYALILEGDHDIDSSIYTQLIPDGTVLLFVDDASIGNGLSASDSLYLLDENGIVRESVGWTDRAPDGFSLERIRLSEPNIPRNWGVSLDSLGTPGFRNSLTPPQFNGRIVPGTFTAEPDTIRPETSTTLSLRVTNAGLLPLSGTVVIYSNTDTIGSQTFVALQPLDTLLFQQIVTVSAPGYQSAFVTLNISNDEYSADNQDSTIIHVRFTGGMIRLNEFLAAPETGQVEFVECVGQSHQMICLRNWSLEDATGSVHRLPDSVLRPHQYLVFSSDSLFPLPDTSLLVVPDGWPSLNNSGDMIRLIDPFGTTIDSLRYSNGWGLTAGRSMEKILPEHYSADSLHWRPCQTMSGHTGGYRNAAMPWPVDLALVPDSMATIPGHPDAGETFTFHWIVENVGQNPVAGYEIRFVTDCAQIDTAISAIIHPGYIQSGFMVIPGHPGGYHPLQVAVTCADDFQSGNDSWQDTLAVAYPVGSVLLNEFMARPNNDQTEFVEWVAQDTVTLYNWRMADSRSLSRPFPSRTMRPGDYGIAAADSLLLAFITDATVIIDPSLPALNNRSDWIRILDHTGKCIDSLYYDDSWPVTAEQSCEKIYPSHASGEKANWAPCRAQNGFTPGRLNSVTLLDRNGILLNTVIHQPVHPAPVDSLQLTLFVANDGRLAVSGVLTVERNDEEFGSAPVPELNSRDTVAVPLSLPPLPSGEQVLVLFFFVSGEMYPADNVLYDTVMVSYPFGSVRFNEFLAIPDDNQVEFVELYNPSLTPLKNWGLSGTRQVLRTFQGYSESEYPVITGDSAFIFAYPDVPFVLPQNGLPSLGNSGASLYLHDPTGFIVDSLIYTDSWPLLSGRSTEKFRPEYTSPDSSHWALCVAPEGATPGEQNSVFFDTLPESGILLLEPNPFSPDGDGYDDYLKIQYKSPFASNLVTIQCYDILGRRIRTLAWRQALAQEAMIRWDGRDGNGQLCRIGMYIFRVELKDQVTGKKWERTRTVVLAKKL